MRETSEALESKLKYSKRLIVKQPVSGILDKSNLIASVENKTIQLSSKLFKQSVIMQTGKNIVRERKVNNDLHIR